MSKAQKKKRNPTFKYKLFNQLVEVLGNDLEFCSIITHPSHSRAQQLDIKVRSIAVTLNYLPLIRSSSPAQSFYSQLCNTDSNTLITEALKLKNLFKVYHDNKYRIFHNRQRIANRIGFKELNITSEGLPIYPIILLDSLESPYPPARHIVLEQHYNPLPPKPPLIDRSCSYISDYCILNEDQLQYTVTMNEQGIFRDRKSGELIAIVVRNLAKDYYNIIQPWSVELVKKSVARRYLTLRNNPKMARVGISSGARDKSLFGWVRNLKKPYTTANDKEKHEHHISSLFGYFYALLRGQVPIIAKDFENAINLSGLPRLDPYDTKQFTLPFDNQTITFTQYPLAPPEGYIAHNFSRGIHNEQSWYKCPWGVYWNLLRSHSKGSLGKESGGSFFIAKYGLRILNDSNTCVIWNRSHLHGTGHYEKGLEHVGIAILLSDVTERCWKKYKTLVENGDLQGGDLLWNNGHLESDNNDNESHDQ
jgi:hypothetical protein